MVRWVEARRDRTDHPTHRRNLSVWAEHMRAELIDRDIDRLMATMVDEPEFLFYGTEGLDPIIGGEAVRANYLGMFELGDDSTGFELDDVVVNDDFVVAFGFCLVSRPLVELAHPKTAAQMDPSRECVLRKRLCLVLPFRDGLIAGETHYFDGPFTADDVFSVEG
jgi:hypothetical protein